MNTSEKLLELLKECRGKTASATAEYLLAHGIRMGEEPTTYDYSGCPHAAADGSGCTLLTNMICKCGKKGLPCGFFPAEEERRALIMGVSGSNKFHV